MFVSIVSGVIGLFTLVLILIELYLTFARKRPYYRFVDFAANFQTMLMYSLLGAVAMGFIYISYSWIYDNFALTQQSTSSTYAWIGGFILADFCHYWFHRTSHENNFLWGIHQGHHTSEDFNFSTAIRKGIFQQWVDWPFFLPMAVLGFPFFEMYLPLKGLQFAYQFWLHNQFMGKIPYFEKLFVTPSAHRVHHGQNPQYIDKNHAGVFIIWDKLFGTYEEENEKVVYGVTVPVNSFNPIGIQFVWWKCLLADAIATRSWWDRIRIPFKRTGWRPADVENIPREKIEGELLNFTPHSVKLSGRLKLYIGLQLITMMVVVGMGSDEQIINPFTNGIHAFALVYLLLSGWSLGCLANQTSKAFQTEWFRLVIVLLLSGLGEMSALPPTIFHAGILTSLLTIIVFAVVQLLESKASQSSENKMASALSQ